MVKHDRSIFASDMSSPTPDMIEFSVMEPGGSIGKFGDKKHSQQTESPKRKITGFKKPVKTPKIPDTILDISISPDDKNQESP